MVSSSNSQRSPLPEIPNRPMLPYDHPVARLDRVTLLSHALWSLAAEKLELTDEQLVERMVELDVSDGVRDHKVSVAPKKCDCGAMVAAKPGWCVSCGKQAGFSPFNSI